MPQFPYKGYSWAVGTTSLRTLDFNVRIERLLALLDEFWDLQEGGYESWDSNKLLQSEFYFFMQEHGFLVGEAARPDKDARQKTSGLVDIGLVDNERRLTEAGKALLHIARSGDFGRDNLLQIPNDSFIYLKQLLKTSTDVNENTVRPFVVTIYALLRLGYLSDDEFTYLIPLCTTRENTEIILTAIESLRDGIGTINEIIISRLMSMDNYQAALAYFTSERTTESVITDIGMNRKSRSYDKPYYPFYMLLYKVALRHDRASVLELFKQSGNISDKPGVLWRQYLFNTVNQRKIELDGEAAMNDVPLLRASTEDEFKRLFFEQMHLFKARANMSDYADLNRRYFKTTDTIIFSDGKAELDVIPRCWLATVMNDMPDIAFTASDTLPDNVDLPDIAHFLVIDEQKLFNNLHLIYNVTISTASEARRLIHDERCRRFSTLVDTHFNRNILIDLLGKFERREDDAIRQAVTNNADIPTIFEYVLGIAWYLISDRQGDVLSYMNLSLEADLLPRTHAAGGNADIEYQYQQTADMPAHCLLIEATLSDGVTQRRMEMEPVSRHLGEYVLSSGDRYAYCVFVSTYLHRNVISDFRNRRTYQYYSDHYEVYVDGLKIIPLATPELQTILKRGIGYDRLYTLFEKAYCSDEPVPTWYEREIVNRLPEAE